MKKDIKCPYCGEYIKNFYFDTNEKSVVELLCPECNRVSDLHIWVNVDTSMREREFMKTLDMELVARVKKVMAEYFGKSSSGNDRYYSSSYITDRLHFEGFSGSGYTITLTATDYNEHRHLSVHIDSQHKITFTVDGYFKFGRGDMRLELETSLRKFIETYLVRFEII